MNWHLLGVSFLTVFLSELGDKSQVAAIALTGNSQSPRAVFFGSAIALVAASFIGVIVGEGTSHLLPAKWVKLAAAIGFAIMAVRLLIPQAESSEDAGPSGSSPIPTRQIQNPKSKIQNSPQKTSAASDSGTAIE